MTKEQCNASRSQAESMEMFTGIELTDTQRGLYVALRGLERFGSMSDQELMVEVLKIGDGDVKTFKACYPNIFEKKV